MFCFKCGSLLPEQANFCPSCGSAQPAGSPGSLSRNSPPTYEYCEIVYEKRVSFFMQSRFWAKAVGPRGIYQAAGEEKWRNGLPNDPGARKGGQKAVDLMVIQLQNDGWEILPYNGPYYWNYKFRRQVV
jgi:hypothetical protein